jgi:hypothetical protein
VTVYAVTSLIAVTLRYNARDATPVLPLLGITSPRRKLGGPSH